jgi:hypothetical protein
MNQKLIPKRLGITKNIINRYSLKNQLFKLQILIVIICSFLLYSNNLVAQFSQPCEHFKPELNIRGSLAIPFDSTSTVIFLDSVVNLKTTWFKDQIVIGNSLSVRITQPGTYRVRRENASGCVNEKNLIITKHPQIILKLETTNFIFDNLPAEVGFEGLNGQGIGGSLNESTSSTILYSTNNQEHIIVPLSYSQKDLSPIHFVKVNGKWIFKKYYDKFFTGLARNYEVIDSSTIVYADHGRENGNPWPFGHIYTVKNSSDTLIWKNISKHRSFYHSVAQGDLNNDGLYDLVGLHMGSYNPWKGSNGLHTYTQQADGSFIENDNIITKETFTGENTGQGSVAIKDILGDKRPEIIKAQYGSNPANPYGYVIYKYDELSKLYKPFKTPINKGVFSESKQGSTSIKFADFNKDNILDMAIASEGYPNGLIQIWEGKGEGDFIPSQILNYPDVVPTGFPDSSNGFREFEIADVDKDGWLDILVHPFHFGNKFRINPGQHSGDPRQGDWVGKGVYINYSIWKNNGGVFYMLPDILKKYGVFPGFLKGFYINEKLKYIGFEQAQTSTNPHAAKLHEFTVIFCNNLIKPQFNLSKFTFCTGDSLKLSVTNVNKGDTLKWYFGTKSDLTNVANKTFTDTTKLFVTRTDSVGCVISSDTIQISKIVKPSSPAISRDSDNNLVANINGTTWYKDGVKISDTTQKIKPTSNGNYTATTTQNGCTSAASANYYYLTSAVANLTSDEYFKVSPNPTDGEIYLNYNIRSTRDVFISVIDMSGRTIISNRKVNSGNKLNLGTTMKGNYIIQVKDKTGRLLTTEKLIKN